MEKYVKMQFGGHSEGTLGHKMWQERAVEELESRRDNPHLGRLLQDVDIPMVLRTEKVNQETIVEQLRAKIKSAENTLEHVKENSAKKNADMDIKIAEVKQKMEIYKGVKKSFADSVKKQEKFIKELKKELEQELKK